MNKFGNIEVSAKTSARMFSADDDAHGLTVVTLSDTETRGAVYWRFKFELSDGREVEVGNFDGGEWIRKVQLEIAGDTDAYDIACALRAIANTVEHQYRTNDWTFEDVKDEQE
ncbi:hypothetical protein ACFYU8_31195 [Brevibacillus sp. NPDC003359]|uniref:hypothetical protein n=1 Tax=unclassified Brevibacillus TaxID=2684853 RepID=UPI003692D22A